MRKSLRALFASSCLLLAGCPYSSDVPLGPPEDALPEPGIAGAWVQIAPPESDPGFAELEVVPFQDRQFYGELRVHEPYRPVETTRYRAYVTGLAGRRYLNVSQLGEKGKFLIARYSFKPDGVLELSFLGDGSLKGKLRDAKALRRMLKGSPDREGLFEQPIRFRKRKEGG